MKKGLFSKLVVIFVIVANILFTEKILDVFRETSTEPAALIGSWFAFTTVELWSLSKIKINDRRKDEQNDS